MERIIVTLLIIFGLIFESYAHSGRTDRYGCHAGSKPYHCHTPKYSTPTNRTRTNSTIPSTPRTNTTVPRNSGTSTTVPSNSQNTDKPTSDLRDNPLQGNKTILQRPNISYTEPTQRIQRDNVEYNRRFVDGFVVGIIVGVTVTALIAAIVFDYQENEHQNELNQARNFRF